MKKILFILLSFLLFTNLHANRDDYRDQDIEYGADLKSPYNMEVKLKNVACGTETILSGDIFEILDVTTGSGTCTKTGSTIDTLDTVECREAVVVSGNTSPTKIVDVEVGALIVDILSELGASDSVIDDYTFEEYNQNITVEMSILMTGNGDSIAPPEFPFSDISDPFRMSLGYRDETECDNPTDDPIEDPEITDECEEQEPCLSYNIVSPVLGPLLFEECIPETLAGRPGYVCYASGALNLTLSLSNLGSNYPEVPGQISSGISSIEYSLSEGYNGGIRGVGNRVINYPISDLNEHIIKIGEESFKYSTGYTFEVQGRGITDTSIPGASSTWTQLERVNLRIIPNNNLMIAKDIILDDSGNLISDENFFLSASGSNKAIADGVDTMQLCQKVTDEFGNEIYADYMGGYNYNIYTNAGIDRLQSTPDYEEALDFAGDDAVFYGTGSSFCFDIASYAPGNNQVKFDITVPHHKQQSDLEILDPYPNNSTTLVALSESGAIDFTRIFTGSLNVVGVDEDENINVGTGYTLELLAHRLSDSVPDSDWFEFQKDFFENSLEIIPGDNYLVESQVFIDEFPFNKAEFELAYKTEETVTKEDISFKTSPYIHYYIDQKEVFTRLTMTDSSLDTDPIIMIGSSKLLGVKVIGTLQGQGKHTVTGQDENFSDLTKTDFRAEIRKNGYNLIKSMTSGQEVNGVMYIEGDYTISSMPDYETIIIKNGNLTISGDLENGDKMLGIIVLQDNYSIGDTSGNVYIDPEIRVINATIYSDGGLLPLAGQGQGTKQLLMNGSLFSRNTIGGSVGDGSTYMYKLPGGEDTSDFELAEKYDLNHLRIKNEGWEDNRTIPGLLDDAKNYTFIIKYNSQIQLDPPAGF